MMIASPTCNMKRHWRSFGSVLVLQYLLQARDYPSCVKSWRQTICYRWSNVSLLIFQSISITPLQHWKQIASDGLVSFSYFPFFPNCRLRRIPSTWSVIARLPFVMSACWIYASTFFSFWISCLRYVVVDLELCNSDVSKMLWIIVCICIAGWMPIVKNKHLDAGFSGPPGMRSGSRWIGSRGTFAFNTDQVVRLQLKLCWLPQCVVLYRHCWPSDEKRVKQRGITQYKHGLLSWPAGCYDPSRHVIIHWFPRWFFFVCQ